MYLQLDVFRAGKLIDIWILSSYTARAAFSLPFMPCQVLATLASFMPGSRLLWLDAPGPILTLYPLLLSLYCCPSSSIVQARLSTSPPPFLPA